MKKTIAFSLFALLASFTTAQAAQAAPAVGDQHWVEKLFRFDFACEFERNVPSATEMTRGKEFEAAARVFANVRVDHDSGSLENMLDNAVQAEGLRNLLAVARNGSLFYSDGALLSSGKREVIIAAATGQRLAIVIPRKEHDAPAPEFMLYPAALIVGDHTIPGACNVRARPVEKGHEYDDETKETGLLSTLK